MQKIKFNDIWSGYGSESSTDSTTGRLSVSFRVKPAIFATSESKICVYQQNHKEGQITLPVSRSFKVSKT